MLARTFCSIVLAVFFAFASATSYAQSGSTNPDWSNFVGAGLPDWTKSSAARPNDDADAAITALSLQQYTKARQHLDTALTAHPNDATLLALYARVEAAAGNLSAAKARADAAIKADAGNALAHFSEGIVLEISGDDAGAKQAYESAIRADPKMAAPRQLLGLVLMREGRNNDAIAQLRAGVQLNLGDMQAWSQLIAADALAGHCSAALNDVKDAISKGTKDALLLQMFVRLASTCPAATNDERRSALEYGAKLYQATTTEPTAGGAAYALALAANGQWDEAVKIQQAAMFVLLSKRMNQELPGYREVLEQFKAHKLPALPWPATAAIFRPARLTPDSKPDAGTMPAGKSKTR